MINNNEKKLTAGRGVAIKRTPNAVLAQFRFTITIATQSFENVLVKKKTREEEKGRELTYAFIVATPRKAARAG